MRFFTDGVKRDVYEDAAGREYVIGDDDPEPGRRLD
jgi:hypothetical protein